jgi:hypothetical protein
MPVIACPKCQGKLKLPDNMEPRRVKCPNCAAVFMSNEAPQATGAAPPPPAKPKPAAGATESKAPRRGGPEKDFDFDDDDRRPRARRQPDDEDEDRPRRRRTEDDEDEDRPRARRRRDDDEEDDRPRRRRSEDDEEEDRPRARRRQEDDEGDYDDEDRPRRRRRDEDDDYEEDPRRAKKRAAAQLSRAELAAFLNSIALWLAAGSAGVFGLGWVITSLGAPEVMGAAALISGLLGLGALGTAAVGYGFAIAGPRKNGAFGLAIATAAVTAVQLILIIFVVIQSSDSSPRGMRGSAYQTGFALGSTLAACTTLSPMLALLGMGLGMGGGIGGGSGLILILMILLEIARYLLFFLYMKAVAGMVKDRNAASSCKSWVIAYSCIAGAVFVLGLVMGLILHSTGPGEGSRILFMLLALISWGGICGVNCWGALVAGKVRNTIRYG